MLQRIVTIAVSRYVGGPARSWIYSSALLGLYRFLKKKTGKQEIIDLSSSKPGDKFIIEHLPITHGEQMKGFKKASKQQAKAAKAEKASAKAASKSAKRQAKAQRKAERKARRTS